MAISFGDNLDKSFAYANGAFKSFSGWFILIILSLIVYGATFAMCFALIAGLIGIFAAFFAYEAPVVSGVTSVSGSTADIGAVPVMDAVSYASVGNELMFSGLLIGGMFIMVLVGFVVLMLASFFQSGFVLRVYRGGELNFKNLGKMFWQGIVYTVIVFLYLIPYMIVSELVMFGPVWNAAYFIIAGLIIPVFLLLFSTLLAINAGIRYAKEERFGAAFQIGKLCEIIGNIGWLRYLGHVVLLALILFVIEILFMMIPFIGILLFIVATPFIMIFQAKFLANLYEAGEALEEPAEAAVVE